MNACKICHQTTTLFDLKIPDDFVDGESHTTAVCSSCWDIIAAIANLALDHRLTFIQQLLPPPPPAPTPAP